MSVTNTEEEALLAVRGLEKTRIEAIRGNDADAMTGLLDEKFIYINGSGKIYDRNSYVTAVRTHELTYSPDLELTETDHRVDGDLVILVGMMLGHARLDGEQQVYHLRNMRVWRARGAEWKLLAWQSSVFWQAPAWSGASNDAAS
ncbi:nuclear transport factor 2 family protein [Sphingomonas sp. RT2P30]|uniref:nuclear transport factor 2 family protein n=1 Tax=Parasphingomonas halimpatiens TaxID=3096162 RepID=UPI002FCB04D5